jgi:hypothetical protein
MGGEFRDFSPTYCSHQHANAFPSPSLHALSLFLEKTRDIFQKTKDILQKTRDIFQETKDILQKTKDIPENTKLKQGSKAEARG